MTKSLWLSPLEKMNEKIFFLLIFLFQLVFIFQGIDLSDEGLYGVFYQQIYKNPGSVEFGFMYWLTGVIGNVFANVFSGLGLLGLRLAGIMVITTTVILAYNLLKKYLNPAYLKLGLFLALLAGNNNPKDIQYNNLSILFYLIIILFLIKGLKENNYRKFIIAGCFSSLCFFLRLPNILSVGLGLVIFYYGYLHKTEFRQQFRQSLFFAAGFITATAAVLLIMKITGQLTYFIGAIKLVASMGSGGTESEYGIGNLVTRYYQPYFKGLKFSVFILVIFLAPLVIHFIFKKHSMTGRRIIMALHVCILLALCYFVVKRKIDSDTIVFFYCGLVLLMALPIFMSNRNNDIKALMFCGCFMILVYPFGSSSGLYTVGLYTLWIAVPIAIDYLFNTTSLDNDLKLSNRSSGFSAKVLVSEDQLNEVRKYLVIFLLFAGVFYWYNYPLFDRKDRFSMRYPIENKYLKGIYTSKGRADLLNGLLKESEKYVHPGDYVLAYDCIPMFHYVTETKPYMRNPWPYLYMSDVFKRELNSAEKNNGKLPVVVVQKIKTIGSGGNWPDPSSMHDPEWDNLNKDRNAYLNDFLTRNNYKEVWDNQVFRILIPENESAQNIIGQ